MPTVGPAQNLEEAQRLLDVVPLQFGSGVDGAAAEAFYEPPSEFDRPLTSLRRQLLDAGRETKLFLSGHIGSGKSTELNRLFVDTALQAKFLTIKLRFEEHEVAHLDASQVLFAIAAQIHDRANEQGLVVRKGKWEEILRDIDARIYGEAGTVAKEATVSLEANAIFAKVRTDLKLSQHRRTRFREFGETQESLLRDLITLLALDIETELRRKGSTRQGLLLLIDDLDKVRTPENQAEIFDQNLNLLLVPPFPVLYTVPISVALGGTLAGLRRNLTHIFPVRVLNKAEDSFEVSTAFIPGSDAFFLKALARRVRLDLFEADVIREAVMYSGGVLREFFRLLGTAVGFARDKTLDRVDMLSMTATIQEERLRESMGLYHPQWQALLYVHKAHDLGKPEDRVLLDQSRVLECRNDSVFFEVNPLLWSPLGQRNQRELAQKKP
jgi:hypothetical protein